MKIQSLHIDRNTFPDIALAIYPASNALINPMLGQIEAGTDLSAVSLGDGQIIAMRRKDWKMLYDAWRHDVVLNKMFEDANQAIQAMTKELLL